MPAVQAAHSPGPPRSSMRPMVGASPRCGWRRGPRSTGRASTASAPPSSIAAITSVASRRTSSRSPGGHDRSGDGQRRTRGGAVWGPVASDGHEPYGLGRAQGRGRATRLPRRRHGRRCRGQAAGGPSEDFRCPRETSSIVKDGRQRNQATSTLAGRSLPGGHKEADSAYSPIHWPRTGANGSFGL